MADTSACRRLPCHGCCCCLSCSGHRYMVVVVASARDKQRRQRRPRQVWVTVATSELQSRPLHSLLQPAFGCRSRSFKCDALLPKAVTVAAAATAAVAAAATAVAAAAEAFRPWSIVTRSQETTTNQRATFAGCARSSSSRSSDSSRNLQSWQLRRQQEQQHKRIDHPAAGRRQTVSRCCRQRKPQQLPLASAARLLLLLPTLILVGAGTIASGAPPNAGPIELDWAGARSRVEEQAAWQHAARKTGRPCAAQSSEQLRAIAAAPGERRVLTDRPSEQQHDIRSSQGQTGPSSSSSHEACESFFETSRASGNRQYDSKDQEAAAASADPAKAAAALATNRPMGQAKAAAAAAATEPPPTQLSIAALDEYARRDTKLGTGDNEPASQQVHMKAAVVTPATGTADDAMPAAQLRLLPRPTRPSAAAEATAATTPLTETQQLLIGAQNLVRVVVQPLKAAEAAAAAAAASAAGHDAAPSSRSVAALPTATADAEFSLLQQATQGIGTRTATLAPSHYETGLFHTDNIGTDVEAAADENSASAAAITTEKMGRFNGDSEHSAVRDRPVGSGRHAVASSTADSTVHRTVEAAGRVRGLNVPHVQAVRQLGQEPVPQLLQVAADAAAAAVATASVSPHTPPTGSTSQTVSSWAATSPRPAAAAAAAGTLKTTAAAAATAAAAGEDIDTTTATLPEGSRTTAGQQSLASAAGAATQSATAAESHEQQQQQQKPSDPGAKESKGGSSNVTGAADSRLLTEEHSSQAKAADSRGTFATSVEPVQQQQQQRTTAVAPSRSTEAVAPPTSRPPSYQGSELQPCEEAGSRCAGGSGQPSGRRPNAAQSAAGVGTTDKPEPISHDDGRGNWAIATVAGAAMGGLAAPVWLIGVPLAYVLCRRRHGHCLCRSRRAVTDNREARYEQHRTEHSHLEELIMLELAKARSRGYVCDSDKVNYDEVFHLNASVANQITTEL